MKKNSRWCPATGKQTPSLPTNTFWICRRSQAEETQWLFYSVILQLSAKKRYVCGAIAIIWIIIPSIEITFTALITDIVNGTCVRFPIYNSYAVMKTVGFLIVFFSFFLPLTLIVFCYARVVFALRSQVISSLSWIWKFTNFQAKISCR